MNKHTKISPTQHLTQELVKETFSYRDGKLYWNTNRGPNKVKGEEAGYVSPTTGRRMIYMKKKLYQRSRMIFLYHHGFLPTIVDHKDRNILNDRIGNLRAANHSQNNMNITPYGKTSKYKGVRKYGNRWRVLIRIAGKNKHFGSYKTEEEAAEKAKKVLYIRNKKFGNPYK